VQDDALATLKRKTKLADLVAGINAAARADGAKRDVIVLADKASNPFALRRPFGLASVDVETGGGPPAGGLVIISGPEGQGKNALVWTCIRTCQHNYGDEASIGWAWFEFPVDKTHGRINGAVCPSSDLEIALESERLSRSGLTMTEEMILDHQRQIGEFVVIEGDPTEHGTKDEKKSYLAESKLDAVVDLTALNACQLIVLDSLGSIVPADIADKSLGVEERRAASARLQTRFQQRLWNALAAPVEGCGPLNLTTILAIGQVRSKQDAGGTYARKWEAKGAHAIRHGKLIELQLVGGEAIKRGKTAIIGKKIRFEVAKGKAGCHEGGRGELSYFFDSGFDHATDLATVLYSQGMLVKSGAKIDIATSSGEVIAAGLPYGEKYCDLIAVLREDKDLFWTAYRAALHERGVSCLHYL
jgi:RecA/RadA recombinase